MKTYLALGDSYIIGEQVLAEENFPNQTVALLTKTSKIDEKGLSVITERFRKNESH